MPTCNRCGRDTNEYYNILVSHGHFEHWCFDCATNHSMHCPECDHDIAEDEIDGIRDYDDDDCGDYLRCPYCRDEYSRENWDANTERIHQRWAREHERNTMFHMKGPVRPGRFAKLSSDGKIMNLFQYHEYNNICGENAWKSRVACEDGTPSTPYNNIDPSRDIFSLLTEPLLGVELEMSGGGLDPKKAYEISCAMGFPTSDSYELKFSRDGSVENGFEIISMPGNLDYHTKVLNWQAGMKKAASLGYRSHDAGCCGLHVHVNRSFFGGQEKDMLEDKFTLFMYNNSEWLKRFSRRTNFTYCFFWRKSRAQNRVITFDKKLSDYKDWKEIKENFAELDGAKTSSFDHHAAISFTPSSTIEFRFFRGTLVYRTFIASLQLVTVICILIKTQDITKIEKLRLKHIIELAGKFNYKELIDYINDRRCQDVVSKTFEGTFSSYEPRTETDVANEEYRDLAVTEEEMEHEDSLTGNDPEYPGGREDERDQFIGPVF